jgi:hypothetical protein
MKACGLTEASLNDEKADAHKVVKYLETFYEDDMTIYRDATIELPKWVPAEIEVSLTCWAAFRRGAQGVKLTLEGAAPAEGLFGEFEGVQEAAEVTAAELEKQQQALTEAAKTLRAAAAKAAKDTGGTDPLPVVPDTTALEGAIDAHAAALRVRSDTARRLQQAVTAAKANAAEPEKAKEALEAAKAALGSFQAKAKRVSEAAALDATSLESAKLEMKSTLSDLQLQIDLAKAKRKDPPDDQSGGLPRSTTQASRTPTEDVGA